MNAETRNNKMNLSMYARARPVVLLIPTTEVFPVKLIYVYLKKKKKTKIRKKQKQKTNKKTQTTLQSMR